MSRQKVSRLKIIFPAIGFLLLFFLGIHRCTVLSKNGILLETAGDIASQLGVYSLIPLLLIFSLALITKDVLISVFLSEIVTAAMLSALRSPSLPAAVCDTVSILFDTVEDVLLEPFNLRILLMVLCVCGMVEVVNQNVGFSALAQRIAEKVKRPGEANLIALLLGFIVSFDDYSGVLIVSPIMKPVVDRIGVSREKLAFIVDATAAPFSALMFISTWVSTELLAIEIGFGLAGIQDSSYIAFLHSIPYSFYSIFCLVFILFGGILEREFGPMLKAERRARIEILAEESAPSTACEAEKSGRILLSVLPILIFALYIILGFTFSGYSNMRSAQLISADAALSLSDLSLIFSYADTEIVMLQAAVASSIAAILLCSAQQSQPIAKSVGAWISGVGNAASTGVMLILTWTFSASIQELGTCQFLLEFSTIAFPFWLAPLMIFATCCLISFSCGSIGTMFIAMPIAIPMAQVFIRSGSVTSPETYLSLSIACVLSGALFGDHCSPISDTTIMSSQACGCSNAAHVWTQLPYALCIAGISALACLMVSAGLPFWLALILGSVTIFLILRFLGKDPSAE